MMQRKFRAAAAQPVSLDDNGRVVKYIFSDGSVARDGNRISTSGWVLDNFKKNPVFLWAHDSTSPPVGRVVEIGVSGDKLVGTVEYAKPDVNPFADTVYRLVKGGFLNAVSVCWQPLTWQYSQDKARPGGIDFTSAELWEVSQVPVPALPSALVTARKAGIDTAPIFEWAQRILRQAPNLAPLPAQRIEALRAAAEPALETIEDRRLRAAQRQKRLRAVEERAALAVNEDLDVVAMKAIRGVKATSPAMEQAHVEIRRRGAAALRLNFQRNQS